MKQAFRKIKGFTLVELLVVVSIIGILSSFSVVSYNTSRARARDAVRLSDVRQMANVLAILNTEGYYPAALEGCNAAVEEKNVKSCTAPPKLLEFKIFSDPAVADPDNNNSICRRGMDDPCQYSFVEGSANVENAKIYFYLETDVVGLDGQALHTINIDGVFDSL